MMESYRGRVQEVMSPLAAAAGTPAISMDIRTSSNYLSFRVIFTHFRGRQTSITLLCSNLANLPFADCNYKHSDLMIGFHCFMEK